MPIITLDGGQSSSALGGQLVPYIKQLVAMQIPGAPDNLIDATLALVLREFYTKSTAWRDTVGPYAISTDPFVELNPVDQNSLLQFVLGAYIYPFNNNNCPQWLTPLPYPPIGGNPSPPSRYWMKSNDVLVFYPVPDQNYGPLLYVYGALIPTTTKAILPNYAYTQHVDALQFGVMSRLYSMKKRPWGDKEEAARLDRKFRQEILMARDIANRGMGPNDTPFQFPNFAGRSASQMLPRAVG
jgi:hypothetical protein